MDAGADAGGRGTQVGGRKGGTDVLAMDRRQFSRARYGAPSGSVHDPEVYGSGAQPSAAECVNWEGYPPCLAQKKQ